MIAAAYSTTINTSQRSSSSGMVTTTYLRHERNGEEAISKISAAAYNMFERLARASEYGRVISPANSH